MWDKESNHSIGSWVPPPRMKNDGYAESHTASIYGRETTYEPSQIGGHGPAHYPPPGYQSGRNTPQSMFNANALVAFFIASSYLPVRL